MTEGMEGGNEFKNGQQQRWSQIVLKEPIGRELCSVNWEIQIWFNIKEGISTVDLSREWLNVMPLKIIMEVVYRME